MFYKIKLMQTTIQFGASSTFQEWSNFKGILSKGKAKDLSARQAGKEPLLKNGTNAENLILHLTKQLQAIKY